MLKLKKQKLILSFLLSGLVSVPFFFKKESAFVEITDIENSLGIKTSIVDIKNNGVIYIKCKFKNAGVLHNQVDKHGISAILGNLMFRKINGLSSGETQEKMSELGLQYFFQNAFEDDFEVSFYVLKDKIEKALRFLSTAFTKSEFSKNDLEFMKEQFPRILDIDSKPEELMFEKLMNLLYVDHNYGLNNSGTAQAISSITTNDINDSIKSNFAKDNLETLFVGEISKSEAKKYLDILFAQLPETCKIRHEEKIRAKISNQTTSVIKKPDMKDIVGVMCGVRIDDLTEIERAALYVVIESLYNKNGSFVKELCSRNIAYKVNYSLLERSFSNVFYFYIFLEKQDLERYLKYLKTVVNNPLTIVNSLELERVKKYFMEQSINGFANLTDFEKKNKRRNLPFEKINEQTLEKVIKKLYNNQQSKIVIIKD
ncbi:MAG: insulinase family protein [Holosporaceae bacterium]|jgi:predicted Zn-dependent peptidase|nr:insulinase family protein [Holosporaceae bacterium]